MVTSGSPQPESICFSFWPSASRAETALCSSWSGHRAGSSWQPWKGVSVLAAALSALQRLCSQARQCWLPSDCSRPWGRSTSSWPRSRASAAR